jgi:hypothetical protein
MNPDEIKKLVASMKEEALLRQKINESSVEYLKLLKDIKNLNKNISDAQAAYAEQFEKVLAARRAEVGLSGRALKDAKKTTELEFQKAKILKNENKELKESAAQMTKLAKEASNLRKSLGAFSQVSGAFSQVRKDVGAISSTVTKGYNTLKSWAGLFEIDKKVRMSALSMGLLDTQTKSFRDNLYAAGRNTYTMGVDIGELAEMQAKFSDELGRTVMLSQHGLESMAAMAKATGLGAEGAAQLAGDFDRIGISTEGAADFIEKTMNDSSKMGLNASKVVKNIQQNMKMLNKYNFKGGVNGLKKMAESMTKLGLDMNMMAPMADKLFDIEGAVDMSAQLQVLGGEWSKLADPFDLMYKARNDMDGLTKEMVDASAASAQWSSTDHQYKISALEMHTLRKVAEATGVSYEELAASAKKAAQFVGVRKQIRFNFDDDTKEFIENTAQFNDKGEAEININGNKKLVSQLTNMDKTALDAMIAEKATLKKRADAAQTFDEKLTNLINLFKGMLMPLVDALDKGFGPLVKKIGDFMKSEKFIKTIQNLADKLVFLGEFISKNPFESLAIAIGGLALFETAKWILSGIALGTGFNISAGKGGLLSGLKNIFSKGATTVAAETAVVGETTAASVTTVGGTATAGMSAITAVGAGLAGIAGIIGGYLGGKGYDAIVGEKKTTDNWNANWKKKVGRLAATTGVGAAAGAGVGALFGGVGAVPGAIIGGIGGLGYGIYDEVVNDGVMFNPKDKFLKLNDGSMIAGTNVNGNKDLANAIMSKKYSDESSNSNSNNTISKVEFGELTINGKLMVETPGSPNMGVDLLKSPQFINELTKKIMIQLNVNKNQIQRA